MKKSLKTIAAMAALSALTVSTAWAAPAEGSKTLQAYYPGITMMVSGQVVTLPSGVEPFIVDDTVYLPARAIGQALGKAVTWDEKNYTVSIGQAPLVEDATQLIDIIEQTHPAFALDAIPAGYQAAKEALLVQAQNPACTLYDFTWAAMAYTASLNDAHTRIDPFGGVTQPALDILWTAEGGHLYVKQASATAEVTAIGGVDVQTVFATIDRYVAAENAAARNVNHAQWATVPAMLMRAGAVFHADNTITITVWEDGRSTERMVELVMPTTHTDEAVITTKKLGDVLYIDFNQCTRDQTWQQTLDSIKQARQSGTKQFIIDVRGNGGGDSSTGVEILNALGMEVPEYGAYVRYSPLAQGTYPDMYTQASGGERYEPELATAKANPDVQLVVLTDEETFSSANMLAGYVRDGKLGTIIGRASANKPNHYGDILSFELTNTDLACFVSHKQWLRPDQSAQGDTLTPDVVVTIDNDALQTALEYLQVEAKK